MYFSKCFVSFVLRIVHPKLRDLPQYKEEFYFNDFLQMEWFIAYSNSVCVFKTGELQNIMKGDTVASTNLHLVAGDRLLVGAVHADMEINDYSSKKGVFSYTLQVHKLINFICFIVILKVNIRGKWLFSAHKKSRSMFCFTI